MTGTGSDTYFYQCRDAFERAAAACGERRRYIRLGPETLCLRFAGATLDKPLSDAFAHHEVPAAEPALTLCCWDSQSTGTPMPAPPWDGTAYGAKGHIVGYNNDLMRAVYKPGIDILSLYHTAERTGIYWMEHPGILPYWERSMPFRILFHWWTRDLPLQLAHAGAVGTEKGGVLLTGKSGSGKSTTATACLDSPLRYAGDDYVLLSTGAPHVYNIYGTAKLNEQSIGLLPHLASAISNAQSLENEKALLFLNAHCPEKLIAGFPLRAIFLPRIVPQRDTVLKPATAGEALLALAPTTVIHLEGDSQLALDKMSKVVHALPSYWLELGTDMRQIPKVIARFLEESHG